MRIGIVTDHGGFGLKEEMVKRLTTVSHEVIDLGAYKFKQEDDYPDFVIPLAKAVAEGHGRSWCSHLWQRGRRIGLRK